VIAVDTSSLVAYLAGGVGADVRAVDLALGDNQACLPSVVLTELLSDPTLPNDVAAILREIPLLTISPGYWERAGRLRSKIIARKRRARLADSLIAQTCLDHDLALITRVGDFHSFAAFAGLKLVADLA
jgi:predicted nucleic acid-binding protein